MPGEGLKIRKIKLYHIDKQINAVWHSPCFLKKTVSEGSEDIVQSGKARLTWYRIGADI